MYGNNPLESTSVSRSKEFEHLLGHAVRGPYYGHPEHYALDCPYSRTGQHLPLLVVADGAGGLQVSFGRPTES